MNEHIFVFPCTEMSAGKSLFLNMKLNGLPVFDVFRSDYTRIQIEIFNASISNENLLAYNQ